MLLKTMKPVLMNEAPADGGAGGGAPAAAPAAAATAPAAAPAAAASSALAGGGAGEPSSLDQLIPEKYRVANEDGTFDLEASVRKLAPGYLELSKKLGAGEAAPETPDAYEPKVEVEGFDWNAVKADPKMAGFLKRFHAKGMNNAQLSEVLAAYHEVAPDLVGGAAVLSQEECEAALREVWKSDAEMTAGKQAAFKAFSAFAEKAGVTLQQLEESGVANNPHVLRLLAAIAPELSEDRIPHGGQGGQGGENVEELMNSKAYWDAKDPQHEAVRAKVKAHFEKMYPGHAGLR